VKQLRITLCLALLWWGANICPASTAVKDATGYDIYIAAGACAAAYSDRIGKIAYAYLEQDGWKIDRYLQTAGHKGARFLLAKKAFADEPPRYILAFVGTETFSDLNFDLKIDKVYFSGNTLDEFTENAEKKEIPNTLPKVHQGFLDFVETGLRAKTTADDSLPIADILLNDKSSKIYLVGHSLGGAAATLAGTGLLNLGINPDQIKVITFGAPPVGNAAFAAKYEKSLDLTRIVIAGDPVTGLLQSFVGGYTQFGRELLWSSSKELQQRHDITEYVDGAVKNYYDHQQTESAANPLPTERADKSQKKPSIYITPLENTLPEALAKEFRYMQAAMQEEYQGKLPSFTLVTGVLPNEPKTALDSGYRWLIIPELSVTKLKQERNVYYITLSQTIYDTTTNAIVETSIFSAATFNLTPLEAFIHDIKDINNVPGSWMSTVK
jgi:Lipase (class 3).